MYRLALGLMAALFLAACGADHTYAPQDQVNAARYVAGPPTSITLFTTINDRNGSGAHSALLVNGSERVLFDPAGTFSHPKVPVQNDVHYGMTDPMVGFYLDYHARDTATEKFHVIEQTLILSPQAAELILRRVKDYGPVSKALCANSVADILRGAPGFESIKSTMFPKKLAAEFATLPGVTEKIVTEANDGADHNTILVDKDGKQVN